MDRACKLIFLADKYHLVQHGRTITGDEYFASECGPVPSSVLRIISEMTKGEPTFVDRMDADHSILSKSDIAALDHVIHLHGQKTSEELKALTDEMVAWQRAWTERKVGNHAPMLFEDFFDEDEDAVEAAYDEMVENAALRMAFPEPANF